MGLRHQRNKWVDPGFWEHPTPLNLSIIVFGLSLFIALLMLAFRLLVWWMDVLF